MYILNSSGWKSLLSTGHKNRKGQEDADSNECVVSATLCIVGIHLGVTCNSLYKSEASICSGSLC
jgi:hypothetical protein